MRIGTEGIKNLLESALFAREEKRTQERIEERGTADKQNPWITDFGKCRRQIHFSLLNVPKSNPPEVPSLMNFLLGESVERAIGELLELSGSGVHEQIRIELGNDGEPLVSGRSDFVVMKLDDGEEVVIEVKKTSSRAMKWMLKRGEKGRDEHRRQLNGYLHGLNLKRGFLVYVIGDAVKGEEVIYVFQVDHDADLAESDISVLSVIAKRTANGHDIERPDGYTKSKFPCNYCDWQDHCWSNGR